MLHLWITIKHAEILLNKMNNMDRTGERMNWKHALLDLFRYSSEKFWKLFKIKHIHGVYERYTPYYVIEVEMWHTLTLFRYFFFKPYGLKIFPIISSWWSFQITTKWTGTGIEISFVPSFYLRFSFSILSSFTRSILSINAIYNEVWRS